MMVYVFFFQAEDGIRDKLVTGVQTCALPISGRCRPPESRGAEAAGQGGNDGARQAAHPAPTRDRQSSGASALAPVGPCPQAWTDPPKALAASACPTPRTRH